MLACLVMALLIVGAAVLGTVVIWGAIVILGYLIGRE